MKRIIYTAVALIFCASVFGVADYFNAKKHGALVNYSNDVQITDAVTEKKTIAVADIKESAVIKNESKKMPAGQKKTRKTKVKEQSSKGIPDVVITEPTELKTEKVDPIIPLPESKGTDINTDSALTKEEKRTINMEMFSRAPIRTKKLKK